MQNITNYLIHLKKNRKIWAFVTLGVFLLLTGWRILSKTQPAPQYQTAKVERGTIISSISASGQILTANIIDITSGAKGIVKKVYVKDNDKVVSGQKILEFTLDQDGQQKSSSAYSSYLSAKNSLDSAQTTLWTLDSAMWAANRVFVNDALSRGLLIYDPTYIQENDNWLAAEAKYKSQQAVIAQVKIAVNNAWLAYQAVSPIMTAPTSGTITNITYSSGMTFNGSSASQRIAVIKAEGTPLATFNISEIDVSKLNPGQKATIQLNSLPDKTFTGKVLNVDRIGSVSSNVTSYPITIQLDTDGPEILPNMSATANIIIEVKDNLLLVPSSAIQIQGTQNVIRVIKGKQISLVNVETGLTSDTQTEIISGLSEGDEVITSTTTSSSSQQGGSVFSRSGFGGGGAVRFIGR